MGKRTIIALLSAVLLLGACTAEPGEQPAGKSAVYPQLQAEIAGTHSAEGRAAINNQSNTYVSFMLGDQLGLFASASLRVHDKDKGEDDPDTLDPVENLKFTLSATGRWIGDDPDVPLLRWDNVPANPADIYAYFPYQENGLTKNVDGFAGYEIFESVDATTGVLKDVLHAERTTVENNNPAIFLTFRHRFALLHIEMGTGMGAITDADKITAVMNKGVASKAMLQAANGVVTLTEGDIVNFAPIKQSGTGYYILIPVDRFDGTQTEELYLEGISIHTGIGTGNEKIELSKLATDLYPKSNTVYNMTLHKGEEGSIDVRMGYIELWEDWNDLSGIRQQGGLYWASDLVGLVNAINTGGYADDNVALKKYGEWDEVNGCWVFKLMRNLDMADVAGKNTMFKEFEGVFDGGGYSITGLDIDVSSDTDANAGFFGTVISGSVIKNLTLVSPSVVGSSNAGALAGLVQSGVTIQNCNVEGYSLVSGNGAVGGLIGECDSKVVRCSVNDISVVNGSKDGGAGGLIGVLTGSGSVSDSRVSGSVTSQGDFVGGLIGKADGTVTGCSANCDVSGGSYVGGLIGKTTVAIENCNSAGVIKAEGDNVGGLIGETSSSVKSCTSDGSVSGKNYVGGLIGSHNVADNTTAVVEGCSSRAEVTGNDNVGGLIGKGTAYQDEVWDEDPEEKISERQGTIVKYCYVLNGKPMIGSADGLVSYGYDLGTVAAEDPANFYYTIVPGSFDLEELLENLNSGAKKVWKSSNAVIGGQGYSIPILTTYN